MGIGRGVMLRVLLMRGRCSAREMVEELVWAEILCWGSGSRGGTGARWCRRDWVRAQLGLCGEHHLLVCPLGELGVGGRIKVGILGLVWVKRVGL